MEVVQCCPKTCYKCSQSVMDVIVVESDEYNHKVRFSQIDNGDYPMWKDGNHKFNPNAIYTYPKNWIRPRPEYTNENLNVGDNVRVGMVEYKGFPVRWWKARIVEKIDENWFKVKYNEQEEDVINKKFIKK